MADIRCLEHPTLKVPYEILNKRFRSAQKVIEREVSHVNGALADVEKAVRESNGEDLAKFPALLNTVYERLQHLDAKTKEAVTSETRAAHSCKRRLEHLREGVGENEGEASNHWKKIRVDRMLVEHFLRSGFYNSAIRLSEAAKIEDLTNISLFLVAKEVEEALARKDTSKCLAWCHDNKSKMRKMKSTLEFNVRLQEYIELVKAGNKLEAVRHARKHLCGPGEEPGHLAMVQQAMALLAFQPDTAVTPYAALFREERWQQLIEQFRAENYRLFQLCSQSVFSVALQAGLSGLKTTQCYNRPQLERNSQCPVCVTPLNELAAVLPFAHCSQSRLICFISGKPLNENNQPMMLPNGFVYGEAALTKMAVENDGQIVCPRTKDIYSITEAEKIYVM